MIPSPGEVGGGNDKREGWERARENLEAEICCESSGLNRNLRVAPDPSKAEKRHKGCGGGGNRLVACIDDAVL